MIGDEVRRRREELGLTGTQLAARAGMAPSAISQIETGKRSPNSLSVMKLAEALNCEVADLFPKAAEPLPFPNEAEQRRIGYAALTAWAEYLELMLERWGELEFELRSLPARSEPDEELAEALAIMDLQRTLAQVQEFFRAVLRVARTADRRLFKELDIHSRQLEAPEREVVRLIRARTNRLDAIAQHFQHHLKVLRESLEERLIQKFMEELEEFLESVRVSEESAEEVR
jgi:transcriptional regulator with XRE-family HTH domain